MWYLVWYIAVWVMVLADTCYRVLADDGRGVSILVFSFAYCSLLRIGFPSLQFQFHIFCKVTWVLNFFRIPYRYIATVKQDIRCTYKRNIDARSRKHCCREITVIILSMCL